MTKFEFLERLREGLSSLPLAELEERLTFYSEMIDDLVEEGYSEEDAIAKIGPVEEIISQISADYPPPQPKKKKTLPRIRIRAWEIILLILGAPLWIPLLVSFIAIVILAYASIIGIVLSAWAASVSIAGCAVGGILGGLALSIFGIPLIGVALIGAGLVLAGISILMFFASLLITKIVIKLTKLIFTIKKKEVA